MDPMGYIMEYDKYIQKFETTNQIQSIQDLTIYIYIFLQLSDNKCRWMPPNSEGASQISGGYGPAHDDCGADD